MKRYIIVLPLLVLLLSACDGTDTAPPPATETPVPVTETPRPGPTDTPQGYPAPPTVTPTPEGYPEPPTLTPLPDGYPTPADAEAADPYPAGDQLLISKPLGTQCSDPATFEYANLNAAVNALIANGIRVYSARITNRMVCEACTCPTSEHFEMIVNPEDAAAAVNLGWNIEGEP